MAVKTFFTGRRALTTVGVIVLAAAFIRLGIWQLDRLTQRRANNAELSARIAQPALNLNGASANSDPANIEYRTATVTGHYDFASQVALFGQTWNGELGVDLLTPLILQGSNRAVLVNRGWIPAEDLHRSDWGKYDQPGTVTVRGMLFPSQNAGGAPAIPATGASAKPDVVSSITLAGIQKQVAEPLLPVYLQSAPDAGSQALPYRSAPQIDLSEGPHLGYAIEWFSFAAIVLIGYPILIRRRDRTAAGAKAGTDQLAASPPQGHQDGGVQ